MEDAPMPSAPSGRTGGYGGDRPYQSGGGYGSSGFAGMSIMICVEDDMC